MKDKILNLRKNGKSFNEISRILGCSKGTISYHCSEGQKEKTAIRRNKRRENPLIRKLENFKYNKNLNEANRKFQKTSNNGKRYVNKNIKLNFTLNDILLKFGDTPKCYLTGEDIDLMSGNYSFDHIVPVSKGGDNSIKNLGITTKLVNRMKTDMLPNELIDMCVRILIYQGYKIEK